MQRETPLVYRIPASWRVWFSGSAALRYLVWKECRKRGVALKDKDKVLEIVDRVKNTIRKRG